MGSVDNVRLGAGFRVKDYADLATKVAALSFFNPSFELLFRGQNHDHKNLKTKTSLLPSIFRARGYFTRGMAKRRFKKLRDAERQFSARAKFKGATRVRRYRLLQWAIIQHYEICATPLLDLTHSLRVACSFSKLDHEPDDTFLYVIGLPYLSGCITTSGDQGLLALRLTSVCPPRARRPHFQEGYLVGEYPEAELMARKKYAKDEWDFGRRLICKFVIPPFAQFWRNGFDEIPREALRPPNDPFDSMADEIRDQI